MPVTVGIAAIGLWIAASGAGLGFVAGSAVAVGLFDAMRPIGIDGDWGWEERAQRVH